jgi:hypothetical protein
MTSGPDTPTRAAAPTPAEREAVISALGDAYAADRIELEELELRMARVYRATTRASLADVMADLSPRAPLAAPTAAGERPVSVPAARDIVSARAWEYGVATLARPEIVPARQALLAIMGGVSRKGAWVVPSTLRVIAVMGGVDLDLREAQFGAGVTEIEVFALMGGVDILVPTGVRVETTGMGILGGFGVSGADADPGPDAPVLRISGVATMGGVDAKLKKLRRK